MSVAASRARVILPQSREYRLRHRASKNDGLCDDRSAGQLTIGELGNLHEQPFETRWQPLNNFLSTN